MPTLFGRSRLFREYELLHFASAASHSVRSSGAFSVLNQDERTLNVWKQNQTNLVLGTSSSQFFGVWRPNAHSELGRFNHGAERRAPPYET